LPTLMCIFITPASYFLIIQGYHPSDNPGPHLLVSPLIVLVGVMAFLLGHLVLASDAPSTREPLALLVLWTICAACTFCLLASRIWRLTQEQADPLAGIVRVVGPLLCTLAHTAGMGYVWDRSRSSWPAVRTVLFFDGCATAFGGIILRMATHTKRFPPGTTTFGGCMLSSMCFILPVLYASPERRARALRFINVFSLGEIPVALLLKKRDHEQRGDHDMHESSSKVESESSASCCSRSVGWSSASPSQSSVNDDTYLEKNASYLDGPMLVYRYAGSDDRQRHLLARSSETPHHCVRVPQGRQSTSPLRRA